MAGKKKSIKEVELKTDTYFGRMQVAVEASCKGKTKDEQIKYLKKEFADSMTQTKMSLDGWGRTLKEWKFWIIIGWINLVVAFLLGIAWGILLFA